jgi:hypothetical protein
MANTKKVKTGVILAVLLLAIALLLSVFLVFACNEDLPMLKSTGAGFLGFGEKETFMIRGGEVKTARPDYFGNLYAFSDGDTFVVVGWIVRLIYWAFCAAGVFVIVNAAAALLSKPEKLSKALAFLLGEVYLGLAVVVIAFISIGYPSTLFRGYTYSTQYYVLLFPLAGALAAALLTKRALRGNAAMETAYPEQLSAPGARAERFCIKCGKPIPRGMRFCSFCGNEVPSGDAREPAYASSSGNPPTAVSRPITDEKPEPPTESVGAFYMPVEDVFVVTGRGTIATGQIQGGSVKNGDTAYIIKNGGQTIQTKIMSIEAFGKKGDTAGIGDNAGLLLRGIARNDVAKGDVISATEKLPADAITPARQPAAVHDNKKPMSILDQYRLGLSYLDGCGVFDEGKFREFNRITGNRFSEADMEKQLGNARMMLRGMEDLKQALRGTMLEAIQAFEEIERKGVDLSKFNV